MKVVAASLAALLCMSTSAQADWQYTKWGMTPQQVVGASSGSVSLPSPGEAEKNKRLERLPGAMGSYRAGDIAFNAFFFFGPKGLDMVALDVPSNNTDPTVGSKIENQLLANYGAPSVVTPLAGGGSKKTWVDGKAGNAIEFFIMRASQTYYALFYKPATKSSAF